jgi:ATPase subunit of ABC transporter with duplicated ATPase domains
MIRRQPQKLIFFLEKHLMSEVILSVKNLTASIDGNQILKGVNLEIKAG